METNRIDGYARAFLEIARAEGDIDRLADELFRVAGAFEQSEELKATLSNVLVPFERKQGVVDDLIGQRTSPVTVALTNLLVGVGRIDALEAVATRMVALVAESEGQVIAEVRSAFELDEATRAKLAERLSEATGRQIKLNVVVDSSIIGGLVAKVEDTIFDGSVRSRLLELREAWG